MYAYEHKLKKTNKQIIHTYTHKINIRYIEKLDMAEKA